MKKILFSVFALMLLILFSTYSLSFVSADILFTDDFSDGAYTDKWTAYGNINVAESSGSLSYDATGTPINDAAVYTKAQFNIPYTFSWILVNAPESFHSFVLGMNNGYSTNSLLVVMNKTMGTVTYYQRPSASGYWVFKGTKSFNKPLYNGEQFTIILYNSSNLEIDRNNYGQKMKINLTWSVPTGGVGFRDYHPNERGVVDDVKVESIGSIPTNQTCTDSDGGLNYFAQGFTYGVSSDGSNYSKTDYCDGNSLYEYNCDGNKPGAGAKFFCSNYGCKEGACYYQKIGYLWGYKPSYSRLETIKLNFKGVEFDLSSATSQEGWNVQYYTYDINNPSEYLQEYVPTGNYNGRYENDGYWYLDYWAPNKTGNYYTDITLYCSRPNSSCWNITLGKGPEAKQRVYFNVTSQSTCTDSDGGKNYLVKGTTTSFGITNETDKCYPPTWLDEGYCDEQGRRASSFVNCSYLYGLNSICSNGACINQTAPTNSYCMMKTPEIIGPFGKGYPDGEKCITDSANGNLCYITDDIANYKDVTYCSYGCSDGVCLEIIPLCKTDADCPADVIGKSYCDGNGNSCSESIDYFCDIESGKCGSIGSGGCGSCNNGCDPATGLCKPGGIKCENSCEFNNKCVPYGIRQEGLYCDIDGVMKDQKIKDSQGNWPKCDNNYECFSNVCSGGECVDVQAAIEGAGFIKKVSCRILSIVSFGNVDYDKCVGGNIEEEPVNVNEPEIYIQDNVAWMKISLVDGVANIPLFYGNESEKPAGNFSFLFNGHGSADNKRLSTAREPFVRIMWNGTRGYGYGIGNAADEYFIASNNISKTESYFLTVGSVDKQAGINITSIINLVTGETVCSAGAGNSAICQIGEVRFNVSNANPDDDSVNLIILSGTTFNRLYDVNGKSVGLLYQYDTFIPRFPITISQKSYNYHLFDKDGTVNSTFTFSYPNRALSVTKHSGNYTGN